MRRFFFALILSLVPPHAYAAPEGKDANAGPPQYSLGEALADPQKRAGLLDELYNRLKQSPDGDDAKRVDATIDALMQKPATRQATSSGNGARKA